MEEETGATAVYTPCSAAICLTLSIRICRSVLGVQEPVYRKGIPFSSICRMRCPAASVWASQLWEMVVPNCIRELTLFQVF